MDHLEGRVIERPPSSHSETEDDDDDDEVDSEEDGEEIERSPSSSEDDDLEDEEYWEEDGEEGEDYEEQDADTVDAAGMDGRSGTTYDNNENVINIDMASTLPQGVDETLPSENANDVAMEVERESNRQMWAIVISKGDAGDKQGAFNGGEIDGLFCPICFEAWSSTREHQVCCLPCGHIYGLSCISKWLLRRGSSRCPLCKMKCRQKDIRLLYATRVATTTDGELEKRVQSLEAKCAALEKKSIYWSKKEVEWKKREADLCKQVKYPQERAANKGGGSRKQEDLWGTGRREYGGEVQNEEEQAPVGGMNNWEDMHAYLEQKFQEQQLWQAQHTQQMHLRFDQWCAQQQVQTTKLDSIERHLARFESRSHCPPSPDDQS